MHSLSLLPSIPLFAVNCNGINKLSMQSKGSEIRYYFIPYFCDFGYWKQYVVQVDCRTIQKVEDRLP